MELVEINQVAQERINTNPHIRRLGLKRNLNFPNNRLSVLIYQKALKLPNIRAKSANIAQRIFLKNGWSNSWRNGIYDFHHFHSNTHECMAICMGSAHVILGGPNGRKIKLKQGDVIVLPAGVGHRCVYASPDFLCVGAYPQGKEYDMNSGDNADVKKIITKINKVPLPRKDPIFGTEGFLKMYWKK